MIKKVETTQKTRNRNSNEIISPTAVPKNHPAKMRPTKNAQKKHSLRKRTQQKLPKNAPMNSLRNKMFNEIVPENNKIRPTKMCQKITLFEKNVEQNCLKKRAHFKTTHFRKLYFYQFQLNRIAIALYFLPVHVLLLPSDLHFAFYVFWCFLTFSDCVTIVFCLFCGQCPFLTTKLSISTFLRKDC